MNIALDPRARLLDGGRTLLGGDPWRVLRLTEDGAAVLGRLLADESEGGAPVALGRPAGEAVSGAAATLGRRLIDAGLAHPRPTRTACGAVTVVIPVRDRTRELDRCVSALLAADRPGRVIVVDDGSRDPDAVAAVCARHSCELIRREYPGGPAAARNLALGRVGSGLVALLDSDCVPEPGWLSLLCGTLATDPGLGAVAPRVRPLAPRPDPSGGSWELYSGSGRRKLPASARGGREKSAKSGRNTPHAGALVRFAAVRSPLDLGPWPSLVRPGGRIAYVPTAALLVRREALADSAEPFDPALRYGEDVDLVWRMLDRGWSVRYDPAAVVRHEEPGRLGPWLARRFRYGSSAGPLARRHPGRLSPVALHPRSVAVLAGAALATGAPSATGRAGPGRRARVRVRAVAWDHATRVRAAARNHPGRVRTATRDHPARVRVPAAAAPVALHVGLVVRSLSRHGVPPRAAAALAVRGLGESGAALGRAATMFAAGPLVLALAHPRTRRVALALVLASPVRDLARLRPALDPLRFTALSIADDVAYGHGVWAGALRARTWRPLRPRVVR